MYGGLFGDLPAAKGQQRRSDDQSTAKTETTAATKSSDATMYDTSISTQRESVVPAQPPATTMFLPPAIKKPKTTSTGPGASVASTTTTTTTFSQTIGAAGTTMAFVPSTVKRKKSRFAKLLESPKVVPAADVQLPKVAPPPSTTPNVTVAPFVSTTTTTQVIQAPALTGPIDIHATQQPVGGPVETMAPSSTGIGVSHLQSPSKPMDRRAVTKVHDTLPVGSFLVEEEDEVAEITDPYDPYVPNDLLQYWDRQALIQEQRQLEEETKQALEQQRVLREQLERERQELQKQGNLTQLAGGMGRGRGRGVSNLPAWLVAQQQQQQQKEDGLGS